MTVTGWRRADVVGISQSNILLRQISIKQLGHIKKIVKLVIVLQYFQKSRERAVFLNFFIYV